MKLAILLTATVKVQVVGGNFTVEERAKMYEDTLMFYAQNIGKRYPIIFLENSDYDLSEFRQKFDDLLDIEWIQVLPTSKVPFLPSKGKGYNEYLMIKKGIECSEKLKTCTHFLKITGRYAMLNITTMIREIIERASNKVFMGDIKDTNIYQLLGIKHEGHWGDSRFFVANVEYYRNEMADCYLCMDDNKENCWAEHYFLNISRKNRKNENFIFRFNHQVQFDGVSGTITSEMLAKGVKRQNSLFSKIKNRIRYFLRILFPNFWF